MVSFLPWYSFLLHLFKYMCLGDTKYFTCNIFYKIAIKGIFLLILKLLLFSEYLLGNMLLNILICGTQMIGYMNV
jgi:hypothetical protein